MRLHTYWEKARSLPPREALRRGTRMLERHAWERAGKCKARFFSTYASRKDLRILPYLGDIEHFSYVEDKSRLFALAGYYLDHTFDLLGSGWRTLRYGMRCTGVEGHVYGTSSTSLSVDAQGAWLMGRVSRPAVSYAKKVWGLVDASYEPIPWQMDFKSGYSWSACTWHMKVAYGDLLGVDIKVPWELSRMQHLPMLARAYHAAQETRREPYAREFRNEILDFIAQNPPKFGVNWRCTMDVGIRVANWLVAYDLFRAFGAVFDESFERVFASSVYDHGRYILRHLEYSPELRSNHYLSDIVGLLFASLHLPATDETDAWLAFSLQELVSEMRHEFHADGSNFEGSTSYHRLSTELMLYGALFAVQMPEERRKGVRGRGSLTHTVSPPLKPVAAQAFDLAKKEIFPTWFWERLGKALRFTQNLLHDDGTVPQIGDNDSGRFLKLNPVFVLLTEEQAAARYSNLTKCAAMAQASYYDENILNHEHLSEACDVLYGNQMASACNFEEMVLKACARGLSLPSIPPCEQPGGSAEMLETVLQRLPLDTFAEQTYTFAAESDLLHGLVCFAYAGMGVYIFRSKHIYMTVRCGEIGQNGNGGHSHNDQLALTLQIDGKDILRDPGTYVYTPLPDQRNRFRSTNAHFTPQRLDGREQNPWEPGVRGLFSVVRERTFAKVCFLSSNAILMQHDGFGERVYRAVEILSDRVVVRDFGKGLKRIEEPLDYSNGYGKITQSDSA
ncbi:alginate lyase family protein [Mitsuokella sp. oral taxon 131]|uniref:alginate lyase family protein n=1 Tax=Mitsuokella sp. oral taxon 131 TaxID=1321780 RepID=UPI00040E764F|nr:alginate lyase family protein [Mitsuokella sp. oral taxon 131]